jgi:Skp family chaperone for outer membrane proteins
MVNREIVRPEYLPKAYNPAHPVIKAVNTPFKINWVLEKIFNFVQNTLDEVTAELNDLADKAKKKAEQAAEKRKAKLEAKAKAKADQIAARQKKQQEKKAKNQQALAKA